METGSISGTVGTHTHGLRAAKQQNNNKQNNGSGPTSPQDVLDLECFPVWKERLHSWNIRHATDYCERNGKESFVPQNTYLLRLELGNSSSFLLIGYPHRSGKND